MRRRTRRRRRRRRRRGFAVGRVLDLNTPLPREDAAHGLEVELLVAVENQHLSPHGLPQRLHRLRLAGPRGAVRVAAVPQFVGAQYAIESKV